MFAVKSNPLLLRSPSVFSDKRHRRRIISRSSERQSVQVQAVISGGDSKTTTSSPVDSKVSNGSLQSSSSGGRSNGEMIEVKAVVMIRKKMKGSVVEDFEDQLEYFINGVGQGIQIQLVSELIDPGLFLPNIILFIFSILL